MIKFKGEEGIEYKARLEVEFYRIIDKRLKALLLDLADEVERKFKKNIILTCLNRTLEENQKYNGSPFSSHLDGRGADIRIWHFDKKHLDFITNYLYTNWSEDFVYVKVHDAGSGSHIHVNIKYKHRKELMNE